MLLYQTIFKGQNNIAVAIKHDSDLHTNFNQDKYKKRSTQSCVQICRNTSFFSKKQFFSMIIMQLSTLVLKEDNSLHYFKHLSRDPFPCVAFAWPAALQLSALQLSALVGQWTFLPCSVGGSRTCKCSEGEARVEDPRRCLHALDSGPNVEYIYSAQVLARR